MNHMKQMIVTLTKGSSNKSSEIKIEDSDFDSEAQKIASSIASEKKPEAQR